MPTYTIDASTILAAVLNETHTPAARGFLLNLTVRDDLVAPGLILAECTSNIRELVFEGKLTESEGRQAVENALAFPVRAVVNIEQHRVALALAHQRKKKKAYDEHYLAVAAILRAELITIDGGMYQGAVEMGIPARLLR